MGTRLGAGAGAVGVLLFLVGSLLVGERPNFDGSGEELAAYLDEHRTRVQLGSAVFAVAVPPLVWFLAAAVSVGRAAGPRADRAGTFAFACGAMFLTLFLADVTTLAISALRPENLLEEPELALALRDFELLVMGMAAPLVSAMLAAFAFLVLRENAIWPRWIGWLAFAAAAAYALRVGTLFTTEGPFAADGLLGIYVPVAAVLSWLFLASVLLAGAVSRGGAAGNEEGPSRR